MNPGFASFAELELALHRVGELLEAAGVHWGVVVVGGAALNLLGVVSRPTVDVDVLALGEQADWHSMRRPERELPPQLAEAVKTVARDLRLPTDWMNSLVSSQWDVGLPAGLLRRVRWRSYGGLSIGIAARIDLIFFKLDAAADQGPASRHLEDLLKLNPAVSELTEAAAWALAHTVGREESIAKVIAHVRSRMA